MTAKYIGPENDQLVNDQVYDLKTQKMTGKRYSPGKDENGKWTDKVGEKDNRVMVWIHKSFKEVMFYKVYESESDIDKHFQVI